MFAAETNELEKKRIPNRKNIKDKFFTFLFSNFFLNFICLHRPKNYISLTPSNSYLKAHKFSNKFHLSLHLLNHLFYNLN